MKGYICSYAHIHDYTLEHTESTYRIVSVYVCFCAWLIVLYLQMELLKLGGISAPRLIQILTRMCLLKTGFNEVSAVTQSCIQVAASILTIY